MVQRVKLFCHRFHPFFIGNAENIDADPASQVDVFLSFVIIEMGTFPADEAHGVSAVNMGDVCGIFFKGIHGDLLIS